MAIQLRNLRTGEKVDTVVRRHWIVFVMVGLYAVGWVALSIILLIILGISSATNFLLVIFWMYYSMFLYISWLNHELDLFVITNNRVICIEQKSFLNRAVGECTLDKIQEVGVETKWFFANILDYGTMTLRTAGTTTNFDMTFSPRPMEQSRHINNIVDRYRDSLYSWAGDKLKSGKDPTRETKV